MTRIEDEATSWLPNPEESANMFSRCVFWWIQGILIKGSKAPLQETDVFSCHTDFQSKLLVNRAKNFWDKELSKKSPSLARALTKANFKLIIIIIIQCFLESLILLAPTVLVPKVSSYFDPVSAKITRDEALMYGCILFVVNVLYIGLRNSLFWNMDILGPVLRIQAATLVYDKACRISFSALSQTSIGHVVTLMSNDAERFDEGLVSIHGVITMPLTVVLSFLLSYNTIGLYSTLTAFGAVLLFIPVQSYVGKGVQICRQKAAPHTDKRIKLIGETIASMKIIKMYGWETVFRNFIFQVRRLDIKYIGIFMLLKNSTTVLLKCSPLIGLLLLLITKYFTKEPVNSEMVFFFLVMGDLITKSINWNLGSAFVFFPQYFHSLGRIQKFLLLEEQATVDAKSTTCIINKNTFLEESHVVGNGCTEYCNVVNNRNTASPDPGVALKIKNLVSTWGGENSFILSDINMDVKKGSLIGILGPVGCGKSSIIMSIIQEMDIVKGSIYCPSSIGFYNQVPWIFNGSVRENIIFNRPMDKEKLDKIIDCCCLTKDIEDLPNGLATIVGERGVQLSGGQRARVSLARVVYGDECIVLLDDPLSAVDTKCASHIFSRLIKEELQEKTVILVTHNTERLSQLDHIYIMDRARKQETNIVGRIIEHGTWEQLHNNDLIKEQAKLREADEHEKKDEETKKKEEKPKQVKEERKTGLIDKRTYFRFWNLSFGTLTCPIILALVAGTQAIKVIQEKEALAWVEQVSLGDSRANNTFITYIVLTVGTILFYTISTFLLIFAGTKSAKVLHNMAFSGILKSPIRFFDITPIGILINRFSKDTLLCDERVSDAFGQFSIMFTSFIASMVVLCISNYYFILILIPLTLCMALVLYFYLKSSVEIRRVEAILRSPVLSHVSGTMSGMSTIRASKQVEVYKEQHYKLRDRHTSAQMIFKAAERWLAVRLDTIVTFIGFFAVLICIYLRDVIGTKLAGLGIVYVQARMAEFQYSIRLVAECENLMTAVERVFSLADLPPEEDHNAEKSRDEVIRNKTKSLQGVVQFKDVSLRYDKSLPFVLHDVNFKTKSCEKIGIVGRTGAGKSSIIQALYRMCEVQGEILINGTDTSTLSLSELRDSISVIPQESLLFSGTLRDNLDPYQTFSDEKLWNTLEQVQLKSYVSSKGGLMIPVEEMGGNMSVGQRQLLCLARALLKKTSLLVVDEATANVDQETDAAIQLTIKTFFSNRTVLTIAHRLNTIIDSDRIMVMESGELVEFDTPTALLRNKSSFFFSLVHGTDQEGNN